MNYEYRLFFQPEALLVFSNYARKEVAIFTLGYAFKLNNYPVNNPFIFYDYLVFEDFKLDFEKFDGGAKQSDFGIGDKSSGNKRHSLNRIFGKMVIYIGIYFGAAVNSKGGGADTGTFNAEFL